ncbi:hypothetical protein F4779DRAFT_621915 [Xylariaceae sp. FL0662B]|nr:hypothetical protein F4779DRAFT_621915 [Xylariaceae sp. FL0662B]
MTSSLPPSPQSVPDQIVEQSEPNQISNLDDHPELVNEHQQDAFREEILDWLTSVDYSTEYQNHLNKQHPGTLQWFVGSPSYQQWLDISGQTLFCPGKPGSGKSVIASVVIDGLFKKYHVNQSDYKTGIAYLYGNYHKGENQTTASLLESLLKQLGRADHVPLDILENLYNRHISTKKKSWRKKRRRRPSLDELWDAARLIFACYSRVFVVIDALDEIPYDDCRGLVLELWELQKSLNISIFVTSWPCLEFQDMFKESLQLPIDADHQDIESYFNAQMADIMPSWPIRTHRAVLHKVIVEGNRGMFIAASSFFEALRNTNPNTNRYLYISLLENLKTLPPTLKEYYQQTMERMGIFQQNPLIPSDNIAIRVLSWLILARRRLKVPELQHILAFRITGQTFSIRELPEVNHIISACLGLVVVNEQTGCVHLAHESIRWYLEKTEQLDHPKIANYLAYICFNYIMFSAFESGPVETDELFEQRLQQYPFFDYSAHNWGHHYAEYERQGKEHNLIDPDMFFHNYSRPNMEASIQAIFASKKSQLINYSQQFPRDVTELHILAYFGIKSITLLGVRPRKLANCRDSHGRTALWWALRRNKDHSHSSVITELRQYDTVTLHLLVEARERQLIRTLLDHSWDLSLLDFQKRTPLHLAILHKCPDIAKDLVAAGANVDAKDFNGVMPLYLACAQKTPEMIQLLVVKSANTKDISRNDWLHAFSQPSGATVGLFHGKKGKDPLGFPNHKHINELRRRLTLRCPQPMTGNPLERCILQFPSYRSTSELGMTFKDFSMILMQSVNSMYDDKQWSYRLSVDLPVEPRQKIAIRSDLPSLEILEIEWNVVLDNTQTWTSITHFTTLPFLWMPSHGIDFIQQFMACLEEKWLQLCEFKQKGLNSSRQNLLRQKGNDPDLLDTLLEGGYEWLDLRKKLQDQVEMAKRFGQEYAYRHDETEALPGLLQTIDTLQRNVNERLSQLDEISRDLIQLEFSLVSINEARRSTTTSASMNRLSWITFIFLPLTFISGLFGMNVDILASNPPWWLYVPFATGTFLITSTIWIVFKRDQELQKRIERKFAWLVNPRRRGGGSTDEMEMRCQTGNHHYE